MKKTIFLSITINAAIRWIFGIQNIRFAVKHIASLILMEPLKIFSNLNLAAHEICTKHNAWISLYRPLSTVSLSLLLLYTFTLNSHVTNLDQFEFPAHSRNGVRSTNFNRKRASFMDHFNESLGDIIVNMLC